MAGPMSTPRFDEWANTLNREDDPTGEEVVQSFVDVESDEGELSPGTYDSRHLPGKHDQKTHGHGGGKVDAVNTSDYGMQHRPADSSYGVSMHDPEDMFPDILEHPEYYATGDEAVDQESMAAIRKAVQGGPETPIKVYRAAPAAAERINPGDWVTPSRTYAEDHMERAYDDGEGTVLEATALAKELHSAGDIAEWGWTPGEGRSTKG